MERLALERKNLVNNVKKLDEAMLALRSVAGTSPAVAQRFPSVLQSLAGVRKSVGVDGPQQLLDYTAPPVDLAMPLDWQITPAAGAAPATASPGVAPAPAPAAAAAPGNGLSPTEIEAELAAVPEPQRKLAAMLPLSGLPPEWTVGKSGDRHLETLQRRQSLREDRRPRRELHPVRRQGDGLRLLSPDRRPIERASALRLRDGRFAQSTGQVRLGETGRVQDRRDRQ